MEELTDLEIKVEVAKIHLGSGSDIHKREHNGFVGYLPSDCVGQLTEFDPLNNDALCFQLMIKHKVELNFSAKFFSQANVPDFENDDEHATLSSVDYWSDGCSHNKAICLVIIEANKSQAKAA